MSEIITTRKSVQDLESVLRQSHIDAMIKDSALAVYLFFGIEVDRMQKARGRFYWGSRMVIDYSGVGTGKTFLNFLINESKMCLVPRRTSAIVFPVKAQAEQIYWAYYEEMLASSGTDLWARHLVPTRKGQRPGNTSKGTTLVTSYRTGSVTMLPVLNAQQDGQGLASMSLNDLTVEEFPEIDARSKAIDSQLLARVRKVAGRWNQHHPFWGNSTRLLGHAQDTDHPSYKRVKRLRKQIAKGDPSAVEFSCHAFEFSKKYEHLRDDATFRALRQRLAKDEADRQIIGIWTQKGASFFDSNAIKNLRRPEVFVQKKRQLPCEVFCYGQDVGGFDANGDRDFTAGTTWRVIDLDHPESPKGLEPTLVIPEIQKRLHIALVWAWQYRGKNHRLISGSIHRLQLLYGFDNIVLDPGGGGISVASELGEREQTIGDEQKKVTPITRIDDVQAAADGLPILSYWGRGGVIRSIFNNERWLSSEDGILEFVHRELLSWIAEGNFVAPPTLSQLQHSGGIDQESRNALLSIDTFFSQLQSARIAVNKDGSIRKGASGFTGFSYSAKKKDLAMAGIYGFASVLRHIHDLKNQTSDGDWI